MWWVLWASFIRGKWTSLEESGAGHRQTLKVNVEIYLCLHLKILSSRVLLFRLIFFRSHLRSNIISS